MNDLIALFNMDKVEPNIRANLIVQLGNLLNAQYSSNLTEPLVYELVSKLNPHHKILKDDRYVRAWRNSIS